MKKDGWKLKSLTVYHCRYGENEGKHEGEIVFMNDNKDSFIFQLTPEKVEGYIDLIREDIVDTASSLGKLLAESLK